jgi:hypothetical protein
VTELLRNAVASGVAEVFLIGAALIGVALVAALFLEEIPLRTTIRPVATETPLPLASESLPWADALPVVTIANLEIEPDPTSSRA